MLTTTVDGLWVLQAVTGVEQTCPELGLRPLLPRLDTAERALRHPVAAELMAVGALDQAGNADPMVREWLTVLLRRDLGLLVTIGVPGGEPTRAAICRFATWWVVLERHGNLVRLYPAGTASDEAGAGELVVGQVERLCGVAEAAPLRPVTVDADELLHAVRDAGTLRSYLLSQRLDVDQLQMVTMAADPTRSAHATLVALQAGVGPEKSARILVGDSTVAIVDTAAGRICVESVTSGQRRYQVGAALDKSMSGPWVGVAAPGTHIMGLSPQGGGPVNAYPPSRPGEKNMPFWGTSFSAAYVSGVAALVRAKFPELTAYQVINQIVQSAHNPPAGVDNKLGYGLVDPVAALTFNIPSGDRMAPGAQSRVITPAAPPPPPDHRARNIAIGFVGAVATGVLAMAIGARLRRAR